MLSERGVTVGTGRWWKTVNPKNTDLLLDVKHFMSMIQLT